jgi:membrane protease YdiL (CAAX protease family)
VLSRLAEWIVRAPPYPPSPADLRTFDLAGLRLPLRATIAVTVMVFAVLLDFNRSFIPDELISYDRNPGMMRLQALDRLVLYAAIPLLVVVLVFRDRPSRYGVRIGDWRAGAALAGAGCLVMTPIVVWFAGQADVVGYYAPSAASLPDVAVTNAVDLFSAEFLFRGFLMFALIRAIGPIGVLVATLPFVFSHLTKPELELLSTLGGGMLYGWLAWRTGSILWGAAAHTFILTLVVLLAGANAAP